MKLSAIIADGTLPLCHCPLDSEGPNSYDFGTHHYQAAARRLGIHFSEAGHLVFAKGIDQVLTRIAAKTAKRPKPKQ